MSDDPKLEAVPEVDIDSNGRFKYILIKVHGRNDTSKYIVRGFNWAEYHADIYERVAPAIEALGLDCECMGGGRIQHESNNKKILVYGYSQGYGRADHQLTVDILRKQYPDYANISFTDEGY